MDERLHTGRLRPICSDCATQFVNQPETVRIRERCGALKASTEAGTGLAPRLANQEQSMCIHAGPIRCVLGTLTLFLMLGGESGCVAESEPHAVQQASSVWGDLGPPADAQNLCSAVDGSDVIDGSVLDASALVDAASDARAPDDMKPDGGGCSPLCGTYAKVDSLSKLPSCASQIGGRMTSESVVSCVSNLACYLGRNPTKAEFLQAMGQGTSREALGFLTCLQSTESVQTLPDPVAGPDGGTSPLGYRCIGGTFVPDTDTLTRGSVWCSYTTVDNDDSIECAQIQRFGVTDSCGTDPIGLHLNTICQSLDGAGSQADSGSSLDEAAKALLKQLTEEAVGSGKACSQCHPPISTEMGVTCFKFPFLGGTPLPPLRTVIVQCPGGDPVCTDGSKPKCPNVEVNAVCNDGTLAKCSGGDRNGLGAPCAARVPDIAGGGTMGICAIFKQLLDTIASLGDGGASASRDFLNYLYKDCSG